MTCIKRLLNREAMLALLVGFSSLPSLKTHGPTELILLNDTYVNASALTLSSAPTLAPSLDAASIAAACAGKTNIWADEDCFDWINQDASRCEASNYEKNCALRCCQHSWNTTTTEPSTVPPTLETTAAREPVAESSHDAIARPTADSSGAPVQCGGRVTWDELSASGESPEPLRIGLDTAECNATVVALFAPWCAPCQKLAHLMLTLMGEPWASHVCWKMLLYPPGEKGNEEIWSAAKEDASPSELARIGSAISKVSTFRVEHGACAQWCTGSNFNPNAGKDDFYVFDRVGRLAAFIPYRESLRFLQALEDSGNAEEKAEDESSDSSLTGWSVAEGLRAAVACDCECREKTGFTLSPTAAHPEEDAPTEDEKEAPDKEDLPDEGHPDELSESTTDDARACALAVDNWLSHPCGGDEVLLHLKRLNSTPEQAVRYYCDATADDSCQALVREAGLACEGKRLQTLDTELGKDGMSGLSQKLRSLFEPEHLNGKLEEVRCNATCNGGNPL